jgi:hypothetical protein
LRASEGETEDGTGGYWQALGTQGETLTYHHVEAVDVYGHRMRHTNIKDGAHSLLTFVGGALVATMYAGGRV